MNRLILSILCLCLASGCVRRRLNIVTDPPGAMVHVDNTPVGSTPTATPFTYYGTREIRVTKPGYETVVVKENIFPKWYQRPPLDFFAEVVWPFEIRDKREVDIKLPPKKMVSQKELLDRASDLRSRARVGSVDSLRSQ